MIWYSGNPAVRQSVPGIWHLSKCLMPAQLSACLIIAIMFIIFTGSFVSAQSTINQTCTEDCGAVTTADQIQRVLDSTEEAPARPNCPESVQSVRQIMALTYGTCEALESFEWFSLPGRNNGYLIEYNGTFLEGYKSIKGCAYSQDTRRSCNYISNYNDLKETHPYNRMDKTSACESKMQCGDKPCLTTFTLAAEPYAYSSANRDGNNIDIFESNTMSHPHSSQRNTSNFLGWNCSEYITTAMALAGQRLVSRSGCEGIRDVDVGATNQQYNATMYANLAQSNQSCTCLNKIDITNDTIRPGDLITINNNDHIMIVESVKEPFFREPVKKEDCNEENIRFDQLQIRVNHSSYTTSGPASLRLNEYLSLNHGQSITHGMRKYIDECVERVGGANSPEAASCWTEEDENEFSDYIFYSKKIGLESVSNDSKWKADGEYIIDPMWPKMRRYLSAICKRRWNQSHPEDQISGVEEDNGFLKVLRHKGTPECTTPENQRPQLKHKECLGECINQEGNQCPTYE